MHRQKRITTTSGAVKRLIERSWMTAHSLPNSQNARQLSSATSPNLPQDQGKKLVELLTQQQVLYKAILKLSSQQTALVDAADAEALLSHLTQRQHLVDRLGQINQEIDPYRQNWRAVYDALPSAVQTTVSALVQQAQDSLEAIIAQDEADRKTLEKSKAAMGGELTQANKAGLAAAAYAGRGKRPDPRFTNHQG